jgi:hypothetical protein
MSRKIRVIALVIFVLMTAGAYAQNVSLREGYYQTQGFADHIFIAPNHELSSQGNTPQNGFRVKVGSYGVMVWVGMPEPVNILWGGTGNIVGNEFRINVERRQVSNMTAHGLSIPQGTLTILRIVDNETFIDESGQRWIWRRQR